MSARRLVTLALVAAAGTAQAVAAPHAHGEAKAKARAKPNARAKRTAPRKARATKLAGGVAWVPPALVSAARPPLAGAAAPGSMPPGPGPATGTAGAATGPPAPGAGDPATTTPTDPLAQQALGVTVDERSGYTMVLSRARLTSGATTVQLVNHGADAHNLRIVRTDPPSSGAPVDLPETPAQAQTVQQVTLAPGSYYLFCTLTTPVNHANAGMHATLRVDP